MTYKQVLLYGGSCRVTIVVAFGGFLPQNIGRWQGPMNDVLSFYECRLVVGTLRHDGIFKPYLCN